MFANKDNKVLYTLKFFKPRLPISNPLGTKKRKMLGKMGEGNLVRDTATILSKQ